nr:MAG TPA: carbohydrate-binding protein [Caudoviricetes sp.]
MGKNLLVGVGGKARHVKALYVGIGGKARKVKKIYVGVGGKARLVYQSYIPVTGISLTYKYGEYSSPDRFPFKVTVYATVSPNNASNKAITWSLSDNNSFSISPNGTSCDVQVRYGYGAQGTSTLTAHSADGTTASINIHNKRYSDSDGDMTNGLSVVQ